jgi:hypothetical protein
MKALIERVNRLEATNTQSADREQALKTTVERRDAETDYLKEQTKDLRAQAANATNELSKVKGTDWAKNVKVKGDLRYRHEMFDREDKDEDRHRDAYVAHRRRGQGDRYSPRRHAACDGVARPALVEPDARQCRTRKSIGLDPRLRRLEVRRRREPGPRQAEVAVPASRSEPFLRQRLQSREGAAINFTRGAFFATAWGAWLSEADQANDGHLGAQAGMRLPFGSQSNVAFSRRLLRSRRRRRAVGSSGRALRARSLAGCFNGNTTTGPSGTEILHSTSGSWKESSSSTRCSASCRCSRNIDYAKNDDPDLNEVIQCRLPDRQEPATTARGSSEPPTRASTRMRCFGQFVDSDFGDGKTDAEGWIFRLGYVPVKNWGLTRSTS